MRSFNEFAADQKVEPLLLECANLMVELEVEPWEFILEYAKTQPKLYIALLEFENERNKMLQEQGFLQGLKQAGGQLMQGLKGAGKQFGAAVAGPQQKFAVAARALDDLSKVLGKSPELANMKGPDQRTPLVQTIGALSQQLGQLKDSMPQMGQGQQGQWQQNPAGGTTNQAADPAGQAAQAAQAPAQAAQQAPAQAAQQQAPAGQPQLTADQLRKMLGGSQTVGGWNA